MTFRFADLGPSGNHIVNDSDPTQMDMIEYSSGLKNRQKNKLFYTLIMSHIMIMLI